MSQQVDLTRIYYPNEPVTKPVVEREAFADDDETKALAKNPKFLSMISSSRLSIKEKGGIPLDEIKRELGLDDNL
ncbi:MAG: hypothetical protein EBE86_021160 [Hormoscilla sp. GUM202]|nr:hypothetical protein [Hormoscilla sp. GUM202]